ISDSASPATSTTSAVEVLSLWTACRKVSWPSISKKPRSRVARIASALPPSLPNTNGPISPAASSETTIAPAPSPNSGAVRRSSKSTKRVRISAPITSTWRARPASTQEVACARPAIEPLQAAPTSIAGPGPTPSSCATIGAVLGVISSAATVATSTMSISLASRPASSSAMRPALTARSLTRSPGAAWRRSLMPVRRSIHSAVTPTRAPTSPLETRCSGSAVPRPAMPAVRVSRTNRRPAVCAVWSVGSSGDTARLPRTRGGRHFQVEDLGVWQVTPNEARENPARTEVDERVRAETGEREHRLAPAHRAHDRRGQLGAHIGERPAGRAGDHRHRRWAKLDAVEGLAKWLDRGGHRGRVKRSRDIQQDRAHALIAGRFRCIAQQADRPRQHQLTGCVVVGHDHIVLPQQRCELLLRGAEDGEHAFGLAGLPAGHQLAAPHRQLEAGERIDGPGRDQCAQLAERVTGERQQAHAPLQLHPAGDAGAEDRRLSEPGALAHPREGILPDELHALRCEPRGDPLGALAQITRLASLAREQARYHVCRHHIHSSPSLLPFPPRVPPAPPFGGCARADRRLTHAGRGAARAARRPRGCGPPACDRARSCAP